MIRIAIVVSLFALFACNTNSASKKPTGTMHDPVEVCERLADVCRLDKSRLGVCTAVDTSATTFKCAPQH